MDHKNNFDLIRAFAALEVAIVHAASHLGISDGPILHVLKAVPGVAIFFVISGYLVSQSYERSDLRSYAVKRVLRIYPGLWVCLAVSTAIAAVIGGVTFSPDSAAIWVVAQATFVQFYNPDFLRGFGVGVLNGSLWTIPVELQFYVLLPLIYVVLAMATRQRLVIILMMVAMIAMNRVYVAEQQNEGIAWKLLGVSALPHLYMFLLGIFLHRENEFTTRYVISHAPAWAAAFASTSFVMWLSGVGVESTYLNPASAIFLGVAIIAIGHAKPAIDLGADVSYGLYIYHMPIINAFVHLGFAGPLAAIGALALSVCLALLSWFCIERHAIRLKHRFIAPKNYSL